VSAENALLSFYDKAGIVDFATGLHQLDWNIYASGGTAEQVKEAGIPVTDVVAPRSDMHVEELERLGIPFLGLVAVDMHPLREVVRGGLSETTTIDETEVGGPTMLHSAAKGRRIVLSLPRQRKIVMDWLRNGRPDGENVLSALAATAERETATYLEASADYLGGLVAKSRPVSSYDGLLRQIGDLSMAS
jgi:phosphoribosylaminoimidazolecarboxamide formyltransferase / IMP cyclohydrolase